MLNNFFIRWMTLAAAIVLVGCASVTPMALDKNSKVVDTSSKSVLLMALDIYRSEPSRYILNPSTISFAKKTADGKYENINFELKDSEKVGNQEGREVYLLSVALEPGQYKLNGVPGTANAFPFISMFYAPLLMDIQVAPSTVNYIGNVKVELRPRQDKEFRAGSLLPLIDQAATGISNSTFDISVADLSQIDIPSFQRAYPALNTAKVGVQMLPPFDRAKAQQWWDGDDKKSANSASTPTSSVAVVENPR